MVQLLEINIVHPFHIYEFPVLCCVINLYHVLYSSVNDKLPFGLLSALRLSGGSVPYQQPISICVQITSMCRLMTSKRQATRTFFQRMSSKSLWLSLIWEHRFVVLFVHL